MSPDLLGFGVAAHGMLCTGAVLAIWKLHGDSKFGKQPQEEIKELRSKVLRSISQSLVSVFEPILLQDTSVEISSLLQADGNPFDAKPKITATGKETLIDAVRDFVKDDIEMLKALRSLDASDSCITNSLIWLRRLTLSLAITSGGFLAVSALSQFSAWWLEANWLHVAGFSISVFLVCTIVVFIWRIMHSVNSFERLKDKHVDLS